MGHRELLLTDSGNGDWIVCQITSNPCSDSRAIRFGHEDLETGGLQRVSYARPGNLFTANEALFSGIAWLLTEGVLNQVRNTVAGLIRCEAESPDQA